MSASELIVDSSSWIDFFHGVELPGLEAALERERVVLPPIVVSELVSGARAPRDLALITDLLVDLPVHQTPLEHWIRVGELRRFLQGRGLTVSTPDAHVAQCALDRGAWLLSGDGVFPLIAELVPLQFLAR
ncbi:MAG TPA: PIN domain-containing protein [Thermoanaerobaculia bacterium]|nr:PIN domain-containing protein [Thermoanaerobaculia bacterium]